MDGSSPNRIQINCFNTHTHSHKQTHMHISANQPQDHQIYCQDSNHVKIPLFFQNSDSKVLVNLINGYVRATPATKSKIYGILCASAEFFPHDHIGDSLVNLVPQNVGILMCTSNQDKNPRQVYKAMPGKSHPTPSEITNSIFIHAADAKLILKQTLCSFYQSLYQSIRH